MGSGNILSTGRAVHSGRKKHLAHLALFGVHIHIHGLTLHKHRHRHIYSHVPSHTQTNIVHARVASGNAVPPIWNVVPPPSPRNIEYSPGRKIVSCDENKQNIHATSQESACGYWLPGNPQTPGSTDNLLHMMASAQTKRQHPCRNAASGWQPKNPQPQGPRVYHKTDTPNHINKLQHAHEPSRYISNFTMVCSEAKGVKS